MDIQNTHESLSVHDSVIAESRFAKTGLARSTFDDVNLKGAAFINVNLADVTFADVNLTNVSITNANLTGMTINGILVYDMIEAYQRRAKNAGESER